MSRTKYIAYCLLSIGRAWCTFERKIVHRSIKSGLSARVNIRFGQRRRPLVPMLRWIIVLGLQQRCKELQNDASSQLEAIDAVWYKLKELCSQMLNKRLPTLASRPILNPSFAVCNQSTLMTRTTVHSLCMFVFYPKNQNVCVRTTRNIDIKNYGQRATTKLTRRRSSQPLGVHRRESSIYLPLLVLLIIISQVCT